MPQFVLLEHDHPFLHWDFMVESGQALRTWRLNCIPESSGEFDAIALPDHRREYLDYEGPVSRNRGTVCRVDRGECCVTRDEPGRFHVELAGNRLEGHAELRSVDASSDLNEVTEELWKVVWKTLNHRAADQRKS